MKRNTKRRVGRNAAGLLATVLQSQLISEGTRLGKKGVSKFSKVISKRKRNVQDGDYSESERISEEWHGRKPKSVTEVVETEEYDADCPELADLEELGVLGQDQKSQFSIKFKTNRPKMCGDKKSKNLEFIGGDQHIKIEETGIDYDGKKLIPLGYLYQIVYETDKHHLEGSNGYPESYEHYFGEEIYKEELPFYDPSDDWFDELLEMGVVEECIADGVLPLLVYNKTDCKLLVVGGKYEITELGIKN